MSAELFWSRVDADGDCWLWTGDQNQHGYGRFDGKAAHRFAYQSLVGPIPEGLQLDHLCRNPPCVNPDHLEPVTNRVNVLRGVGPTARNARKVNCLNGHPLSGSNLYVYGGMRKCRQCTLDNDRARKLVLSRTKQDHRLTCACGHRFYRHSKPKGGLCLTCRCRAWHLRQESEAHRG